MTRQAISIWKEVLDTSTEEGSPPRPDDMSEPQWTALVFGRPWCTVRFLSRSPSSTYSVPYLPLGVRCAYIKLRYMDVTRSPLYEMHNKPVRRW